MEECLQLFEESTADWFQGALGTPTQVQRTAWPAIAAGGHVLVSAPTGTGKTLSAFLVFLDRLKQQAETGMLEPKLQVIYVSPLKSLAADIRENLKKPLAGIGGEKQVKTAIRTGDTTQQERRQMVQKPPHILITTPESLYLMLTSKTGRNMLCTAQAVIVDELHALIDTKRGAHLMLSLARLDALCARPLQRIGLSATIAPLSKAAEYLAPEPVFVAAPAMEKRMQLQILGSYVDVGKRKKDPVWQELSVLVYQYCQEKRSVIAFVEGRRYAEKLAYYVNLLGGEDFARVHHGSLSKEQRQATEQALREGRVRLLCATSSMELGIDVGEIDRVLQVGCPRTVSGTMQRLGRAGHNPSRISVMYLFPRTAAESVQCGMTAQLAREGQVERLNPPEGCLDVLAQHLVSMAAVQGYEIEDVMEILPRAWPFRNVTKEEVKRVLGMLAGDYEHEREVPVRPRILYDRIHEHVEGDGYSRMLAVSAGGTIPDKGLYTVRTEAGVKVGEADEEFIYETRLGDRFILGAFAWKVLEIGRDTVTVTQAPVEGARLPFWKGELKGRNKETGVFFGRMLHWLQEEQEKGKLQPALMRLGLDEAAAMLAAGYLKRQMEATGGLPDHRTILAEHFRDQSGHCQLMVHSVFGRRVNGPLALLAVRAAEEMGIQAGSVDEEDGFLIYSYGEQALPDGLLHRICPETAADVLAALLPATPVFNMAFRYNCGRALMMGVRRNGRQPLWMQRLRSAQMLEQVVGRKEHPLIQETRRECMEQLWDVAGVRELLEEVRSGGVLVREIYTETPSPMSLPLQWAQEAAVMYDYAPTPQGIHKAVEDALKQEKNLLQPDAEELSRLSRRKQLPKNPDQLHTLFMVEGDLAAGELEIPVEWLEQLAEEGRVLYLEQGLWIAAEQQEEYRAALEEFPEVWRQEREDKTKGKEEKMFDCRSEIPKKGPLSVVRRMLRYRSGAGVRQTARRYGWPEEFAKAVLEELVHRGEAVPERGNHGDEICYYHADLYQRARTFTIRNLRTEISTCPPTAYTALLLSRLQSSLTSEEGLKAVVSAFAGTGFPAGIWEELLFPARVKNYREKLLDALLSTGEFFWYLEEGGRLFFEKTDRIDWEKVPEIHWETLSEKECLLAEALSRRGASFLQALSSVLEGESPYDTLISLVERGVVNADSFVPVRRWLSREKIKKAPVRRQVGARMKVMNAGRFDLVRPLRPLTIQEQMERCFDRYLILCRETAVAYGLPWQETLSVLRVQEYTGQVRRGYFVEGLSGAQFLRRKDFESVTAFLKHPQEELVWLNAADPIQPWGKLFSHEPGRAFLNVPGTAVAFWGGRPAAVFERQGKVLRVFEPEQLEKCICLFAEEYRQGRIYAGKKRIVVKEYPGLAAEPLALSGFLREMQDYALYR